MKKRILWIEDAGNADLGELSGYMTSLGEYDLTTTIDVTDGIRCLMAKTYDAIVVDIRMLPGELEEWQMLYYELGGVPSEAKLGKHLLYSLCEHPKARIQLGERKPKWLLTKMIGVYTIESNLQSEMEELEISTYVVKTPAGTEDVTMLVRVVEEILKEDKGEI